MLTDIRIQRYRLRFLLKIIQKLKVLPNATLSQLVWIKFLKTSTKSLDADLQSYGHASSIWGCENMLFRKSSHGSVWNDTSGFRQWLWFLSPQCILCWVVLSIIKCLNFQFIAATKEDYSYVIGTWMLPGTQLVRGGRLLGIHLVQPLQLNFLKWGEFSLERPAV